MKVDVIVAGGWILRRMANEIVDRLDYTSLGHGDGDIVYYVAYALYKPTEKPTAVFLTHYAGGGIWPEALAGSDVQICMCNKTADVVREQGGKNIHIIRPAVHEQFFRDITFGIVGEVKSNRKGEHLVQKMVEAGYNVKAWGLRWPCEIVSSDFFELPDFYRSIDYLVVPSVLEGGPMPVIEAISMGVPVIAPDVGWCWEFPVIQYEVGEWDSLNSVLQRLTKVPTWEGWASEHDRIFREMV